MNGNIIKERAKTTTLLVLSLLDIPYTPSVVIAAKVAMVAKLRGSVIDVIRGMVPMVQSAHRNVGLSSSHELTKQR